MKNLTPQRPESAISLLINELTPHAVACNYPPRKIIEWKHKDEANIYLFLDGQLSILRSSDKLVLGSVYEPHIFGIVELFQHQRTHALRLDTPSTVLKLSALKAKEIFRERNLWCPITEILAYYISYLGYRDSLVYQQLIYSVIREHLFEIMNLPDNIRKNTTILRYIQDRTHLSRSSILNNLSTLKNEGRISYARGGYLLEIISLPEHPTGKR
ncbi:helix-turn-helix domain-containing protein [Serratia rhizosphaerae]